MHIIYEREREREMTKVGLGKGRTKEMRMIKKIVQLHPARLQVVSGGNGDHRSCLTLQISTQPRRFLYRRSRAASKTKELPNLGKLQCPPKGKVK